MNSKEKNQKQWELDTGLVKACQKGRLDKIRTYAKHGANLELKNSYGRTPLMIATHEGNLEVVKILVELGAELDKEPLGLLVMVVNSGSLRPKEALCIMDYLLIQGMKKYLTRPDFIATSARTGQIEMIKLLMSYGCNPDEGGHLRDTSAYYNAIARGKTDVASFFINELNFDKMKYYRFASKEVKEMIDIMNEKERIAQGLEGVEINRANIGANINDGIDYSPSIINSLDTIKRPYLGKI